MTLPRTPRCPPLSPPPSVYFLVSCFTRSSHASSRTCRRPGGREPPTVPTAPGRAKAPAPPGRPPGPRLTHFCQAPRAAGAGAHLQNCGVARGPVCPHNLFLFSFFLLSPFSRAPSVLCSFPPPFVLSPVPVFSPVPRLPCPCSTISVMHGTHLTP